MARRTKMEAEQTREQIIDAAEELFLTRGVARATLEQIAQAAGVTRGAIYWHFRNKTDLFDAMYCRVHDPVEDLVSQSLALEDEGAIEALRNFCVQSLLSLARDRRRRRVYSILFHHCEFVDGLQESNQRLIAIQHRGLASMEALFRRAREQGSLPNVCPRLAAIAIHTSMLGLYFDYLWEPDAYDLEREAAPLVDLIFRCIT